MGDQELCTHAMVPTVTIESVDATTVSFWTRSASQTGDPAEQLRRLFKVRRDELWTAPIPGFPPPVALRPGATGPLYLSKAGWQTTTPDGFQIFGAASAVFKLPVCLGPADAFDRLSVIPSKLVVQGYAHDTDELVEIDLLGPDAADAQDVRWNGSEPVEIRLRNGHGARAHVAAVKLWPIHIVVAGSAASAPAVPGEVDLLDVELAAPEQHLQFHRRGAAVELALTQDGFGAFHVIPGM